MLQDARGYMFGSIDDIQNGQYIAAANHEAITRIIKAYQRMRGLRTEIKEKATVLNENKQECVSGSGDYWYMRGGHLAVLETLDLIDKALTDCEKILKGEG
jgi:hypothetical protein